MTAAQAHSKLGISIGGTCIEVASTNPEFLELLQGQYADFVTPVASSPIHLELELQDEPDEDSADRDVEVRRREGLWQISRGDFEATYDPDRRSGAVRQSANRHSIDSVIRIIHSLTLASESGFLLHSASAIRSGCGYLFSGRSGAGKTTLSRLTPADAHLLSDEVSYVRKSGDGFRIWGTPFTGELGTPGENMSAPLNALCFLCQAKENRLVPLEKPEALRLLMGNILFFADDAVLVKKIFETACELIAATEVYRFDFTPDSRAWELIQ